MADPIGLGIDRVKMTPRDVTTGLPGPTFEVDASIEETHSTAVQVTRHPVYKGIPVADNGRAEPDGLAITVFFSDSKTRIDEALQVTASALQSGTFGTPSVYETFELLRKYAKDVSVWEIETSLKPYDNMVLESVETPRNAASGQALTIPLKFTELRTASIEVNVKVKKRPLSKAAKKDTGAKAAPAPAPSLQEKTGPAGLLDMVLK